MARPTNNHLPTRAEKIGGLRDPAELLLYAMYYFILQVFTTVFVKFRPLDLFNISKIRNDAFSAFWLFVSAGQVPAPEPSELQGSAALVPPLLAQVKGDVLELGPGTGTQLSYLTPTLSNIKSYTFAEPAVGLHTALLRNASAAGLTPEKSTRILACGASPPVLLPALDRAGLLNASGQPGAKGDGVFDTIVCIRVLCSVPGQREVVAMLRHLLRPGGRLVVVEHVVNPWKGPWGSRAGRALQVLYAWCGWSYFVGDCDMARDTEAVLRSVGTWEGDLALSQWWGALPYISGILVKPHEE